MAIAKLQALHAFLETQNLFTPEKFESWMEDGDITPRNKNLGADQLLVSSFQYNAIFTVEEFNSSPDLLIALVCAWLIDNDQDRDTDKLPSPSIDIDMLDANLADVEIKIVFKENIELIADDEGAIALNGRNWSVAPLVVYTVDTVGVGDDQAEPTDKPYTVGDDQ